MTYNEAISWLKERGVLAKTWGVGKQGIIVWDRDASNTNELSVFTSMVHLYLDDQNPDSGQWILDLLYIPGPSLTPHLDLYAACEAVCQHIENRRVRRALR